MAYTPRSFTNKPGVYFNADKTAVLFAEDINYIFERFDLLKRLGQNSFFVSSSDGAVAVDDTSAPELVWGNVLYNPDANYDPGTGTYYVETTGFYHFDFRITIGPSTVNKSNSLSILVDGVPFAEFSETSLSLNKKVISISVTIPIDGGATVSFQHYTNDPGGVTRLPASSQSSLSCFAVSYS